MRVWFRFRTQFDFIFLIFVENLRNTLCVCLSVGRHNLRAVATIDDDNEYANVGLCPWEQTHVSAKWNDHWNVNKMTSLYVLATRMSHAKTTKNKSTNFACVLVVGKQRPGFVCICFYEFLMIRHRRRSTAAACAAGRTFLLFSSHSSDRLELRCAVATIGLNMKSQFRGSQLLIDEAEQKTNANTYSTTQLNSITLRANCHSHLLSLSLAVLFIDFDSSTRGRWRISTSLLSLTVRSRLSGIRFSIAARCAQNNLFFHRFIAHIRSRSFMSCWTTTYYTLHTSPMSGRSNEKKNNMKNRTMKCVYLKSIISNLNACAAAVYRFNFYMHSKLRRNPISDWKMNGGKKMGMGIMGSSYVK